ncbi:MAG: DUF4065 domain-containing protein [Pseudomonadota bacterium]|nr:DUF4065 domain-containing protein [Pseudomonadota bacterium]
MKNKGSSFNKYLLENLKEDDQAVFLHIKNALASPDIEEDNDYLYLIKAIDDVATARGKTNFAEAVGLSRQGLHKILSGDSIPSIQNIIAILNALGLRFSVEQIQRVVTSDKPAKAFDVAQYVSIRIPKGSTCMKLQKIVYYSQVESLVHYKKPLFEEKILAWAAGPVVKEIFNEHRGHRYFGGISFGDTANLSMEQKSCIDWAVGKYGSLDGDMLSHLTHVEDPWKKAREGLPPDERSEKEITIESMIAYYSELPKYRELEEQTEEID